jgi:Ca-activated chloride channel homolog
MHHTLKRHQRRANNSPRRGAMLILVLAMLMSIIALSAFSVDVAYMQLVRTQLRATTDAAAKAAGEALSRQQSGAAAIRAAQQSAKRNLVAGKQVKLQPNDIELGRTVANRDGSWGFQLGRTPYNSVRVTSSMAERSRTGSVKLLFAHMLGNSTFSPTETATVAHLDNEVVLSVDRSHSMCFDLTGRDWSYARNNPFLNRRFRGWMQDYYAAPHPTKSRWASLAIAVNDFLDIAEKVTTPPKVSLVTWGSDLFDRNATPSRWKAVVRETPLNAQYRPMRNSITQRSRKMMMGGTNLSAGLDAARDVLQKSRSMSNKTIIMMTDGQWNSGRQPTTAARDCQRLGIVVHTVTFLPRSDQRTMRQVAEITGGRHFHATNQQQLRDIFQELARSLPIVLTE